METVNFKDLYMSLLNCNPTTTKAWKKLTEHFSETEQNHMKNLFSDNAKRATDFTIEWNDFLVDFSKNRINEETIQLLLQLAEEVNLKDAIEKYYGGDVINQTEGRAVLHTALRAKESDNITVDGVNVVPEVYEVKKHIKKFTEAIISGQSKGYTGK